MATDKLESLDKVYFSMKIGIMNGFKPYPFSESFIEFPQFNKMNTNQYQRDPLNVITLSNLFSEACGKLRSEDEVIVHSLHFKDDAPSTSKSSSPDNAKIAVDCLNSFLRGYEKHEVALNAVRENEDSTDTEWCAVLATHLFSQLVPGGKATVCKSTRFQKAECPCGCAKKIVLGNTGIGHKFVWHGFPDLMVEHTSIFVKPTQLDEDESSESNDHSAADDDNDKNTKSSKNKEEAACSPSERLKKNKSVSAMDFTTQLTSQTITNAFAQRKVTKLKGHFYPTIGCTMNELMIMFYDPDHDILLRRKSPMVLFNEYSKLFLSSIVELWFILNLLYFDSKVKAGISERLGVSGVKSFFNEHNVLQFYEKAITKASTKQLSSVPPEINADLDYLEFKMVCS